MTLPLTAPLSKQQNSLLRTVAETYAQAGYRCLLVGGSVRDLLLGHVPKDFDFTTNAPVNQSFKLFKKVIPTGVKHGTVTLLLEGQSFEVTRFRKDVETDGRHAVVEFAETIEEDLSRRDLRINAIAYDLLSGQLIDPEQGLRDIQEKVIHFVGQAQERILEDHLRAIRYLRMIAKLDVFGFTYIPQELAEVTHAFDPSALSLERIYDELNKMRALADLDPSWLIKQLSELRIFRSFIDADTHPLALTWLFQAQNQTALGVLSAIKLHTQKPPAALRLTKRERQQAVLILRFLDQDLSQVELLKSFLSQAQPPDRALLAQMFEGLSGQEISLQAQGILDNHEPLSVADLSISTTELLELGFQGPALGQVQRALLSYVWIKPEENHLPQLRQQAQQIKLDHSSIE